MEKIKQLIKWCEEHNTRKEYILVKARLKMIKTLCEEISSLEDTRFVEELVNAFSEIIDIQQEIIDDMKMEYEREEASEKSVAASEDEKAFLMPIDGFKTERGISEAFSIYLEKVAGKKHTTVYDYCSRIRNLFKVMMEKDNDPMPLLNAYNNIDTLIEKTRVRKEEIEKKNGKDSKEFKNIANASAALGTFDEFRKAATKERVNLDKLINDKDIYLHLGNYRIGQIANEVLRGIIKAGVADGRITKEDIERFKTERGSHSTFGLSLPLLAVEPKDGNGMIRYYKEPIICYGETLYLNSQWPMAKKERLIDWISDWIDNHGGI